ncbi:MAG: hypothetical protein ABR961_14845 [Thermoanaerobaculaceae bacterium]|jgi:hypothetical protein
MKTRWIAAVTVAALAAASSALAVEPTKTPAARPAQLPPGVTILKSLQFRSVVPKINPQAVTVQLRYKFDCYVGWQGFSPGNPPYLSFVYRGTTPVQTEHLVVHWEIQYCCNGNMGAATSKFLLYPNQGWIAYGVGEIPPNFNPPPQGQPTPACTAYGWMDQ